MSDAIAAIAQETNAAAESMSNSAEQVANAVESIAALKARALCRLEIDFGEPVQAEAFADLPGVRDLTIDDSILRCSVMGSLDALVKAAARYEVSNVRSVETSLEEIFMAYYGAGDGIATQAAGGEESSHAAA